MMSIETISILGIVITAIGAIGTIPTYKGWMNKLLRWNLSRKLKRLKKEKAFFETLKASDREFVGWIGSSLLILFAIFAVAMMFQVVAVDANGEKLALLFQNILGMSSYLFAIYRLGQYRRFRNYEKTMEFLNEEIKKYEERS